MSDTISLVILAAGEGKRLKLNCPKALAPMAGRKLVDFPVGAALGFLSEGNIEGNITLVLGHGATEVKNYINSKYDDVNTVFQENQLGTADAVNSYLKSVDIKDDKSDYTFVMCADTPMIGEEDLTRLYNIIKSKELDALAATFLAKDPFGYGRIVLSKQGFHIVEEKDANEETKEIQEVNSGLYVFKSCFLRKEIKKISNKNQSGEFYLTDIFEEDKNVKTECFENEEIFYGVNDLQQLQQSERFIRWEHMGKLRDEGVRLIDLSHTYIDLDVEIGVGTCIYPNVFLEGKTKIGADCLIEAGSIIRNSVLHDSVNIKAYSHLEDVIVRSHASIGPFGRLRPGTDIGAESKIGNFVEIKKSKLEKGVKVSHLSYVGDAEIGEESNIGCGFVTCNYDGKNKHKTEIGKNCFIGSNSQTVAPVEIGNDCFVASGSTINQPMEDGSFAISRGRQVTKPGLAKKFIKK
ncbi:MAG: bifunctional UDP-N-acetylglucosamine diphosphorylase/glucosamine-1-phosphate N-acetyltransferase GlmU [Bacteriovoracaceae bacterium]|jgi:bifunctional UDP-N-acetylglucosamine pyrophosphorylase / glucosamine-1-phosphate N-acetyltransferase|nr:bifunctional UDP-N-acetylglucosamine diphosphorylase/glucosamine-1-phosphate N-acetyltransferase GlmU [Bacteriovoracaceae bacterium]